MREKHKAFLLLTHAKETQQNSHTNKELQFSEFGSFFNVASYLAKNWHKKQPYSVVLTHSIRQNITKREYKQ